MVFQEVETVYAIACCCRKASDDLGVLAGELLSVQNIVQDLALSDFHLVPTLKEFLGWADASKAMKRTKNGVKVLLNGLATEVYEEGVKNLSTGCDKCLNVGGDCVGE